jgi:hypothetical protein
VGVRNKAGRFGNSLRSDEQRAANKDRNGPVQRIAYDPGMGHGAQGTFVTGQRGVFGMYVNRLNHTNKRDQKNASQRKSADEYIPAFGVSNMNQTKYPGRLIKPHLCLGRLFTYGLRMRCVWGFRWLLAQPLMGQ